MVDYNKNFEIIMNAFKTTTIKHNNFEFILFGHNASSATVKYCGKKYYIYGNPDDQLITLWADHDESDAVKTSVCDIISNNIFSSDEEVSVEECISQTCAHLEFMIKKLEMLLKLSKIATLI